MCTLQDPTLSDIGPRTFSVVNRVYPDTNVAVDTLGTALMGRKFCLICGHRQSGKSTTAFAVQRWLHSRSEMRGFDIFYNGIH